MNKQIITLEKKLVIGTVLLLVIVGMGIGFVAYLQAYRAVFEQTEQTAPRIAALGARIVKEILDRHKSIIGEVVQYPDLQNSENLTQQLQVLDFANKRLGYMAMAVIRPNGTAYYPDGTTASLGDREYFKKAMNGETNFSEILISRVINAPVMILASPIRDHNKKTVSVLLMRLDARWLSEVTDGIRFGVKGDSFIIDRKGKFIAHANRDFVLKQVNFIEESLKKPELVSFAGFLKNMAQKGSGIGEFTYEGKEKVYAYTPIPDTEWILAVGADKQNVYAQVYALRSRTISILKDISEGEGDLTRRLDVQRKDEIGEMAKYFDLTLEKIARLIVLIKDHSIRIERVGIDLAASMEETAASIHQILANIQSIERQTGNQSDSVYKTKATLDQITSNIEMLDSQIKEQAGNLSESSSAIEQMMANIQTVSRNLVSNTNNILALTEVSRKGQIDLQEMLKNIQQVSMDSEGLLAVSKVIQDIASQTNLLAMNAAIEAAHAGTAGKGFAVVASEIRKLAESSEKQAKTVSSVLHKIKQSVDQITKSTNEVFIQFDKMARQIEEISKQETAVRDAMQEQTSGSQHMLSAIGKLNQITREVHERYQEIQQGSRVIIQESETMQRITVEVTGHMKEMVEGAWEIHKAVQKVNELSAENKSSLRILVEEIGRFKT
mgnify:CR=1 FL=1